MTNTKTCTKCLTELPYTQFSKHAQTKDGLDTKCKKCKNLYNKKAYNKNREYHLAKAREYSRKRKITPHIRKLRKAYTTKEWYKKAQLKYIKKHAHKRKAKNIVNYLVSRGVLKQMPCEICGKLPSEAHHPDYAKPLHIKWLCRKHHKEIHRKYK